MDEEGELLEDATENQDECSYCVHNPATCDSSSSGEIKKYGGQFCDSMKCKLEEYEEKEVD